MEFKIPYLKYVRRFTGLRTALTLFLLCLVASCGYVHYQNQRDDLGRRLVYAVGTGDVNSALRLLDEGADPNTPIRASKRPFPSNVIQEISGKKSVNTGEEPVLLLAVGGEHCGDADMPLLVRTLLAKGADATSRESEAGRSMLMMAVLFAHPETVQALLDHGVAVNEKSGDGWTALQALRIKAGFVDIKWMPNFDRKVAILKQAGATDEPPDFRGWQPR